MTAEIVRLHEEHSADLGEFRPRLEILDEAAAKATKGNPSAVVDVEFLSWRTFYVLKAPKVRAEFRVVTMGPDQGTRLARFYRVQTLRGKPRVRGGFKVGASSELLREYVLIAGLPPRLDRVPLSRLTQRYLKVRVSRVVKNSLNRPLPYQLQYDRIEEILGESNG